MNKKKLRKPCPECGKSMSRHTSTYCSTKCQMNKRYNDYINDWKEGKNNGMKKGGTISGHIRRYIFEKYNNKCVECGWDRINPYSNKSALEVHHKDGNGENNDENNLLLICPNCHSLTKTFKSLNKGNGRVKRRKPL